MFNKKCFEIEFEVEQQPMRRLDKLCKRKAVYFFDSMINRGKIESR